MATSYRFFDSANKQQEAGESIAVKLLIVGGAGHQEFEGEERKLRTGRGRTLSAYRPTKSRSALYSEVFPIGAQDAVQLLLDSLGGDLLLTLSKYADGSLAKDYEALPDGPSARSQFDLSSCGLEAE